MRQSPRRWGFFALLLGLAGAGTAQGQMPFPPAFAPPPPGPLMYVRFTGPKETKITIYRGFDAGHTLELPCTVGFRPGYSYRLAVWDIPALPRQVFCPSLEVRATLALIPKLRNADFPAHIHFTEDEFRKAFNGSLIKKIITLERPDLAIPIATLPDAPLELNVEGSRDPLIEAAQHGQPLVVVQMGQRFLTPQELNSLAVPGTILLPGDRVLGTPRVPPWVVWNWYPVYDPVYGPRNQAEFTTLYDGGDVGAPAGFNRDGKLKGLDPTDTIAEYLNSKGERKLAISNRVALCIPRFVIYKSEFTLVTQVGRQTLDNKVLAKTPSTSIGQLAPKEQTQQQHTEGVDTRMRLSGAYSVATTSVFGRMSGVDIKTTLRTTESVQASALKPQQAEPADGPLRIIKWPDKKGALVGEVVTFFLKYTNTGGQPITSVVVSDSLTARFEYVKGSRQADRDALFTMQPNEVGSDVLRWEFTAALQPGEHGLISFQVRVR